MEEEGKRRESCSFNSFFLCFSSFSFFATTTSEKQTRSCTLHRNSSVHPFLINPLVIVNHSFSSLAICENILSIRMQREMVEEGKRMGELPF